MMSPKSYLSSYCTVSLFVFLFLTSLAISVRAGTIEGIVYDHDRNPLSEVTMELRNDSRQMLGKVKTKYAGQYRFVNLPDGRYYIRAVAFGYNLADEERMVILDPLQSAAPNRQDIYKVDFYLRSIKGGLADTVTGASFAQEVPKEALDYYKEAIKLFRKDKHEKGLKSLIKSVETYPTYYDALNRLGTSLLDEKRYMDAASMFVRAVEVNPASSKSFFHMGVAFSNLGEKFYNAAVAAFGKAETLAPNAYQVQFELGKIQYELGNYSEAELKLNRAKELAPVTIPEIHLHLAQVCADGLKQFGKAADELEKYIETSGSKDKKLKKKVADLRAKGKN